MEWPSHEEKYDLAGLPPQQWTDDQTAEKWRAVLLDLLQKPEQPSEAHELLAESTASFSDGINTGFYINSYTTKHCPTMDGVLEELRRGIERLETQRRAEEGRGKEEASAFVDDKVLHRASDTTAISSASTSAPGAYEKAAAVAPIVKTQSAFGKTLATLTRLSASYRRCYWKSGSEMLFPIMFGHLTFASHRCWTVYLKRAVFLACEAWRRTYGQSILHSAKKAGGGVLL